MVRDKSHNWILDGSHKNNLTVLQGCKHGKTKNLTQNQVWWTWDLYGIAHPCWTAWLHYSFGSENTGTWHHTNCHTIQGVPETPFQTQESCMLWITVAFSSIHIKFSSPTSTMLKNKKKVLGWGYLIFLFWQSSGCKYQINIFFSFWIGLLDYLTLKIHLGHWLEL